jgi:hypothetical protein
MRERIGRNLLARVLYVPPPPPSPSPSPSPSPVPLVDAVRRLLSEEGRPPSRRRVEAWIAAGAVTVEGRVVRDPAAPVAPSLRVSLDLDALSEVSPGAPGDAEPAQGSSGRVPTRAGRAGLPAGVLHADGQLVVCDRGAFPATLAPEAFAAAVAAALASTRGRPVDLHPVADPSAVGSGIVLLGTSRAGAARLAGLLRTGAARETLLALRVPPLAGPAESIVQSTDAPDGNGPPARALIQREDAPPGPPPHGARDGVPPHRAALTFKHPRTNRRLTFACEPSAEFGAACARWLTEDPP